MPRLPAAAPAPLPRLREEPLADRVDELRGAIDLLVVTATSVERDAVLRRLRPLGTRRVILQGTVGPATYYLGALGPHGVALTLCRMGAAGLGSSHAATAAACATWAPRAVVMVGIAFGKDPDKQAIGDVLVSSQIISYEEQRIGARTELRGPIADASQTLVDRFRNVVGWRFPRGDETACSFKVGAILSGEKLVDDAVWKASLFAQFPQALGGEMEGRGLYSAATEAGVAWILVKAICDWGDGTKHKDDQGLAAASAVDLTWAALSGAGALDGLAKPGQAGRGERSRAGARKAPAVRAGARSVVARGNITGSTVVTGDGNHVTVGVPGRAGAERSIGERQPAAVGEAVTSASVRKLVGAVLRTDSELDAFVLDYFETTYARFSAGMDRVAKMNLLLRLVELEDIVARLGEFAPDAVARERSRSGGRR